MVGLQGLSGGRVGVIVPPQKKSLEEKARIRKRVDGAALSDMK
jgi:hypothetical protein